MGEHVVTDARHLERRRGAACERPNRPSFFCAADPVVLAVGDEDVRANLLPGRGQVDRFELLKKRHVPPEQGRAVAVGRPKRREEWALLEDLGRSEALSVHLDAKLGSTRHFEVDLARLVAGEHALAPRAREDALVPPLCRSPEDPYSCDVSVLREERCDHASEAVPEEKYAMRIHVLEIPKIRESREVSVELYL
jgi:hypothetical protein